MKFLLGKVLFTLCLMFASVSLALASGGAAEQGGGSFLLALFIGFFALIVVFQLVPACLLFVGMIKGLSDKKQDRVEKGSEI